MNTMRCTNHPDLTATVTCRMPSATKQSDGEYREDVPLCESCATAMAKLAPHWPLTPVARRANRPAEQPTEAG